MRAGQEHQPAQGSFLTAAEGPRRFPSREFQFSHLSAGPLSTHLDSALNGPTSLWSFPGPHDLTECVRLLAKADSLETIVAGVLNKTVVFEPTLVSSSLRSEADTRDIALSPSVSASSPGFPPQGSHGILC